MRWLPTVWTDNDVGASATVAGAARLVTAATSADARATSRDLTYGVSAWTPPWLKRRTDRYGVGVAVVPENRSASPRVGIAQISSAKPRPRSPGRACALPLKPTKPGARVVFPSRKPAPRVAQ